MTALAKSCVFKVESCPHRKVTTKPNLTTCIIWRDVSRMLRTLASPYPSVQWCSTTQLRVYIMHTGFSKIRDEGIANLQ